MDLKYMTRRIMEENKRRGKNEYRDRPEADPDPKEIREVTEKPRVFFDCHPDDFEKAFPLITEDILKQVNCTIWYDADTAAGVNTDEAGASGGVRETGSADTAAGAAGPAGEETEEQKDPFLAAIKRMQLIVLAVTEKFINSPNRAKDVVLRTAIKEHIPILPVTLEKGLGSAFSENCAKIQIVPRYNNDSTATPYGEVLKTFLNSVLVSDELARKVRAAFDAYVFMSYRKKDRYYAQRLMRLIHENPEYRDIAIWYDEFLVPGEGYNEAIKDAFTKSGLFALCVTPHLQEEGNYVMVNEYKWARDRDNEEEKFRIVPVEMYDDPKWRIDQKELEEFPYKSIEDLEDEHRRPELDSALVQALDKIAKTPHEENPQHTFFIGLAYLAGIDVQADHKKAVSLIKEAALGKKQRRGSGVEAPEQRDTADRQVGGRADRQVGSGADRQVGGRADSKAEDQTDGTETEPCTEAAEKLVDMYSTGEGVEPDRKEAIRWQKEAADQYFDKYGKHHDPDEHKGYGTRYFKALMRLAGLQRDDGDIGAAIRTAEKALEFSGELEEEVGIREKSRDTAVIYNQLGNMYKTSRDYDRAEWYYQRAREIYERLAAEIGTDRARRDLSISYEHLGDIRRRRKDIRAADGYYQKAEGLRAELVENAPESLGAKRDLSAILTKIGNIRKDVRKYGEAGGLYRRALEMDRALADETRSVDARDDLSVSLIKVGDILKKQGDHEGAAALYREAEAICRKLRKESALLRYQKTHAAACEKLAGALKKTGGESGLREAAALFREAVLIREQIVREAPTEENLHDLAVCCYNAWLLLREEALIGRASGIWTELSAKDPKYEKYREMASGRPS